MQAIDRILSDYDRIMEIIKNRWLDGMFQNRHKINKVFDMLSDEDSRNTYVGEILYCELNNFLKGDLPSVFAGLMSNSDWNTAKAKARELEIFKNIKAPETSSVTDYCIATTYILKQYQYKNLVKIDTGDICLDIGSCFGDTSLWFVQEGAAKSYAFEIDKRNIECLKINFGNNDDKKLFIEEFAISDAISTLYYKPHPTNIGAGKIYLTPPPNTNEKDFYPVKAITIDEFCSRNSIVPNFIKMDIEGAELSAIKGGIKIFQKYRPKFAICIYHSWPHRWEIPLLLNEILPDYDFYVKKSSPICETVFFGHPKKR